MKIYTKTGDKGMTSLLGGTRVAKHHLRIECYGTVDELNSYIGMIRANISIEYMLDSIALIQNSLFVVGATLAADPSKKVQIPLLKEKDLEALELGIDQMELNLPTLKNFILPGGHTVISYCHIARCVCRRAERLVVSLNETQPVPPIILKYLNRLSDYLFVMGRKVGQELGVNEIIWVHSD